MGDKTPLREFPPLRAAWTRRGRGAALRRALKRGATHQATAHQVTSFGGGQ